MIRGIVWHDVVLTTCCRQTMKEIICELSASTSEDSGECLWTVVLWQQTVVMQLAKYHERNF